MEYQHFQYILSGCLHAWFGWLAGTLIHISTHQYTSVHISFGFADKLVVSMPSVLLRTISLRGHLRRSTPDHLQRGTSDHFRRGTPDHFRCGTVPLTTSGAVPLTISGAVILAAFGEVP